MPKPALIEKLKRAGLKMLLVGLEEVNNIDFFHTVFKPRLKQSESCTRFAGLSQRAFSP